MKYASASRSDSGIVYHGNGLGLNTIICPKIFWVSVIAILFSFPFNLSALDYYWVGGSGNWGDHNTHWATSSGGNVFHTQPPTTIDNVYFDGNSFPAGGTVTLNQSVAYCNNMDWTGASNSPTFHSTDDKEIRLYGSLILTTGITWNVHASIRFLSTQLGNTIYTSGNSLPGKIIFDGISGEWILADSLDVNSEIVQNTGTLRTNGNKVSMYKFYSAGEALYLGSSLLVMKSNDYFVTYTMIMDAGTSHIIFEDGGTLSSDYKTFNNVSFEGTNSGNVYYTNISGKLIFKGPGYYYAVDNNTINEIEFKKEGVISSNGCGIHAIINQATFSANGFIQGCNDFNILNLASGHVYQFDNYTTILPGGTLNANGSGCDDYLTLISVAPGLTTYINTSGANLTLQYLTVMDIVIDGGGTIDANNSVDLGGNSGWNFMTLMDRELFWVNGDGNWSDLNHWSLTSGGPGGECVPSAFDNVTFDQNSGFNTTGLEVRLDDDRIYCHDMTWQGVMNVPTFKATDPLSKLLIYGSLTLDPSMILDFSSEINFKSTQFGETVNTAGHAISGIISFEGYNGEWILQDSLNVLNKLSHSSGTLRTNGMNITAQDFYSTGEALYLENSSVINITNFYFQSYAYSFDAGLSHVIFTNGGILATYTHDFNDVSFKGNNEGNVFYASILGKLTFEGVGKYYGIDENIVNDVEFQNEGTISSVSFTIHAKFNKATFLDNGIILGYNDFQILDLTPGHLYRLGSENTILPGGVFNANGTGCNDYTIINSIELGIPALINTSGVDFSFQYITSMDMHVTGGGQITATNSVDLGGNSGWNFMTSNPRDLYWVGGGGNWSDINHWALTSGGSGGECIPSAYDNVNFDQNSGFNSLGQAVTIDDDLIFFDQMIWQGVLNNPVFNSDDSSHTILIHGSLYLDPNMTVDLKTEIRFRSRSGIENILSSGKIFKGRMIFEGEGGEWHLLDSLSVLNEIIHSTGKLKTNGNKLTINKFFSTGQGLNFGSSEIKVLENSYFEIYSSFFDAGTSHIKFPNGGTLVSSNLTFHDLSFGLTNNAALVNSGSNGKVVFQSSGGIYGSGIIYFNEVEFQKYAIIYVNSVFNKATFLDDADINYDNVFTDLILTPGKKFILGGTTTTTITAFGNLDAIGSSGFPIEIKSNATNYPAMIYKDGAPLCLDYVWMTDIKAIGSGIIYAGANSVDVLNNEGIIFDDCPSCISTPGPAPILDTLNSITKVQTGFYASIKIKSLPADHQMLWFNEKKTIQLDSSSSLWFFYQMDSSSLFYGATRDTATGCLSELLEVLVCAPAAYVNWNYPLCTGETLYLQESGVNAVSWLWNGPNSFSSSLQYPIIDNLILSDTGIYTVDILDRFGCDAHAETIVDIDTIPDVNPTPDTLLGFGQTHPGYHFAGTIPGSVFFWLKTSVAGLSGTTIDIYGYDSIPSFNIINNTNQLLIDTIMVYPLSNESFEPCVGVPDTFLIVTNPVVTIDPVNDTTYCHQTFVPGLVFTANYSGPDLQIEWVRSGPFLGISPSSGNDSIPSWTSINTGNTILTDSFTVTPSIVNGGMIFYGTPLVFTISVYPQPIARCKNTSVVLDLNGQVNITPDAVDDGSTGGALSIDVSQFTCQNLGSNIVNLTATDSCGNFSTCSASVTVLDLTAPLLVCNDITRTLSSGQCGLKFDFIPDVNDNCPSSVSVRPLDTSLYKFGQLLLIGSHNISFLATDPNGNTSTCSMNVVVLPIPNPTLSLACISEVQISLNENCEATIGADDILTGGPYRCFDEYKVEVRDWYSNALIDRNPNLDGAQVGKQDIGKQFRVSIKDTVTGNSCWTKVTIEDKLPPKLTCPRDTTVICGRSLTTPDCLGTPIVVENCGDYSLTYYDDILLGNCAAGYQELIRRIWTATDETGNKSSCVHTIRVDFINLNEVEVPLDYDGYENPTLSCDEKINRSFDFASHLLPYPYCVDGFLLDSAHWFATGGFLPSPVGDLAGDRIPRTLGWNCIDTGKYIGHPSPYPIYYPPHPEWNKNNPVCWGPDQVVMWLGTGVPENGKCINISYNFQDLKIDLATPNCDAGSVGCFKILRQWTVLDWCTGQWGGSNQLIKVMDKKAPSVVFPDSVLVTMDDLTCSGKYEVPQPWLTDNCSNDIHYSVTTESGIILGNEIAGYVITNIQRGTWNAYIVAEDCCGNVTRYRFVITGQDLIPPNPVCDKKTVVSLNLNHSGESFAQVFAKDLDQSSFDNCSPHVFFKVIRMEQLRGTIHGAAINQPDVGNCTAVNGDDHPSVNGNQIFFDDYARYCCGDVGKTIRVVLRVFDVEPGEGPINPGRMSNNGDLAGHFNDCMIDIEVQDKTLPTVQAPPDIVVSCWFWFDVEKLDDPNDPTFGKVVTDLSLRKKIIINDLVCHPYCVRNEITGYPGYIPGAPQSNPPAWNRACDFYRVLFDTSHADRKYDMTWGFDGTVLGACGTNFGISVNDSRQCGQGRITRTILARGPNGTFVTATQTIWIVDCDPFYINRDDDCDPDDDITWPGNCTGAATTIDGCGADISPDNPLLGRPKIENSADDLCSLISTEYFDEIFTIEPDACFKVLRKWVVIDWCQYDPNLSLTNGRWEYLQIIKVHDTDKPVIDVTVSNCIPALKRAFENACFGYLEITADATDNCSPFDWLFYEYKVDLYNDGKGKYSGFDHMVSSLSPKQFAAGKKPYLSDNPAAVDPNNPFEASGTYPLGIHKICWYVEDGCGNLSVSCKLFEVEDCKKPTPYCHTGIITTVMPSTKCITIWARDYDIGSFDNCTESKDLRIYFGANNADSMTICCDDFKANNANDELTFPVVICVEDEEGNFDCCVSSILVQDPHDVCPNVGSNARVIGSIQTMMDVSTKNVKVQLFESLAVLKEIVTNNDGQFLFGDLSFGVNKQYVIKPMRTDNPLNGVSTADIVKIQRHILGQENLPTPYQWIAADVNRSSSISAADVSDIRKLVLGVIPKFDKSDSWTFVPKDHPMDVQSPWSTPRDLTINANAPQNYKADFISIKMGDVNNSVVANNLNTAITRSSGILQFEIDSHTMSAGELYILEFKSRNFNDISGYQFTLKFDEKILTYEGFESGALNLSEGNFGTHRKNEGYITTSWNTKSSQTIESDVTLFSLLFRTNTDVNISDLLSINNHITTAEAYDEKINIFDVSLAVIHDNHTGESSQFELYQNTPNPFGKETTIHFVLPESIPTQMSIYDVAGKVVWTEDIQGKKGWNSVKIKREVLQVAGVYYYQLNAGNYSSTKRMVVNSD